jgi:hypothetical protein
MACHPWLSAFGWQTGPKIGAAIESEGVINNIADGSTGAS